MQFIAHTVPFIMQILMFYWSLVVQIEDTDSQAARHRGAGLKGGSLALLKGNNVDAW